MITFQVSTHYLAKISLRLEALYESIVQATKETKPAIHHFALLQTLEIMKLIEKPELKSRFLKELLRLEYLLSKSKPNLSESQLKDLHQQIQTLSQHTGRLGGGLFHDPFLMSVRLYQCHLQPDIELDSPQLLLWLERPGKQRQTQIKTWLKDLLPLIQTVKLYLSMLRDAAHFESVNMHQGFFQQFISDKRTCALILVRLPVDLNLVPKIQIGHHGIHIRFCDALTMKEQTAAESPFELAISQLS